MSDTGERHASWLELFFDLVVVVAVAQLAHRLAHPTWVDVGLFVALYYAVWSVWTSLTLYSNVRGDRTQLRSMLLGMFGIAVMAAAAPEVANHLPDGLGERDKWFAVAYVFCRLSASRSLQQGGTVITGWPAAQLGAGITPWLASLGVDEPFWRYTLWGLGVLVDIVITVMQGRHPEHLMGEMRKQAERMRKRLAKRGREEEVPMPAPAILHNAHLGERLGLFVIIVLGEAVMQVVMVASEDKEWDWPLGVAALAGFGLVVSLWWLTLQYGLSAVPNAPEIGLKPVLILPAHFLMTGAITAAAAGLGVVAAEAGHTVPAGVRWLLCGGLALYFAVSAVLGVAGKASRRWILLWGLPTVVAPVLIGLLGARLAGWGIVALLLGVALWRVLYRAPFLSRISL